MQTNGDGTREVILLYVAEHGSEPLQPRHSGGHHTETEFEDSLAYIVRPGLKQTNTQTNNSPTHRTQIIQQLS